MEEVYQILTWALSGTSAVGLLSSVMWWRTTKRSKEAETRLQEIQTKQAEHDYEQKRLDDLRQTIGILDNLILNSHKESANKEEIIADKTKRIREKDETISGLMTKLLEREQFISAQARFIDWLKNWHCRREYGEGENDCTRREPEQKVKVSYDAPPEMEERNLPAIMERRSE